VAFVSGESLRSVRNEKVVSIVPKMPMEPNAGTESVWTRAQSCRAGTDPDSGSLLHGSVFTMVFENGTATMTHSIRFCLVLHNHQPIGNFDHVFEQAYQDSYLPFLEVFEAYRPLRISLHTSGPLMEWLANQHPEYLDRLADLVEAGRVEIVGGPFYEPILTMIPSRDRIGQIETYSRWLEQRLGARPRGMWVPERVWEQSLTSDLSDAGIEYLVLDDYHFRTAGLTMTVCMATLLPKMTAVCFPSFRVVSGYGT